MVAYHVVVEFGRLSSRNGVALSCGATHLSNIAWEVVDLIVIRRMLDMASLFGSDGSDIDNEAVFVH